MIRSSHLACVETLILGQPGHRSVQCPPQCSMTGVCELEGGGGEPACLLKGEGGSPPFHSRPLWQLSTFLFLCYASLEAACSLCSSRSSQLLCSRRRAVFVFNLFRPNPFTDWRYPDNTRPGVHIHSTRTDERIPDPCMVSEPPVDHTLPLQLMAAQDPNIECGWSMAGE